MPRYVLDESVPIYVILRTQCHPGAELESYTARLGINLEVQAHGQQPKSTSGQDVSREDSPARNEDTLWSGSIDTSENPKIIDLPKGDRESLQQTLAIWKTTIPLSRFVKPAVIEFLIKFPSGRPKTRLQAPVVTFKLTATLQSTVEESNDDLNGRYLPSGVPASVNLLESLKNDPAVHEGKPKLSAARLSRMSTSISKPHVLAHTVKTSPPRAIHVLPAISSRVRYARANGFTGKPSIIASLDIETAPFSSEIVDVTAVDMEMSDGSTDDLSKSRLLMPPLNCKPKDNPVFLFRLTPYETPSDSSSQTSARTVLITVHATVLFSPSCRPKIQMRWKTGVDFSTALNPVYGTPRQSMQRLRRPNSLSRTHSNTDVSSLQPSSRENDKAHQGAVSINDFGVSVIITTPKSTILGQPFSWNVLILNRSTRSRQLALTIVPKRNQGPKSEPTSMMAGTAIEKASGTIDETLLYVLQRNMMPDVEQVISLSTDVRTG